MSRLDDASVVTLQWGEDERAVFADGHQSYEIDENNEIAVFHGEKCTDIRKAVDFNHAVSMVMSSEAVCSYNKRNGTTRKGYVIDEWGCAQYVG